MGACASKGKEEPLNEGGYSRPKWSSDDPVTREQLDVRA